MQGRRSTINKPETPGNSSLEAFGPREARGIAHRAVTEGVNIAYVEQMRKALYALADAYEALDQQQQSGDNPDRVKLERLVCWSNRWGDLDKHPDLTSSQRDGYELAMGDVRRRIERHAPDWLKTWTREGWSIHEEPDDA